MKLSPKQLHSASSETTLPVYHLFGAEPLIIEETLSALRKHCTAAGFIEREKLHVETGFNWDTLGSANQSLSLFASKKIIELRIPNSKPGDKGSKALIEYCQSHSDDTILIVISGAVERAAQNSKWFKALDAAGASVEVAAVKKHEMATWIDQRLKAKKVVAEAGVAQVIAHYVEGNLLAAAQQVNFLSLQKDQEILTSAKAQAFMSDQARFTAFAFIDACLAGDANRASRILNSLQGEKAEPILLLGALARETRKLVILANAQATGQRIAPLFQRLGIWSSRSKLTQSAVNRISAIGWNRIHSKVTGLDRMIKGQQPLQNKTIWEEMERIGLAMCGQAAMLR